MLMGHLRFLFQVPPKKHLSSRKGDSYPGQFALEVIFYYNILKSSSNFLLNLENKIIGCFKALLDKKISAMRTRVHGDYHLGQNLAMN